MSHLIAPGTVHVYANWGRWIADCAFCDSACTLLPFAEGFLCQLRDGGCGRAVTVVWPSDAWVASIERLLLMRPNPKNQNWLPGETPDDLYAENMAHGVLASYLNDYEPGVLMSMTDGVIMRDSLPRVNPRRELVR